MQFRPSFAERQYGRKGFPMSVLSDRTEGAVRQHVRRADGVRKAFKQKAAGRGVCRSRRAERSAGNLSFVIISACSVLSRLGKGCGRHFRPHYSSSRRECAPKHVPRLRPNFSWIQNERGSRTPGGWYYRLSGRFCEPLPRPGFAFKWLDSWLSDGRTPAALRGVPG